MNAQTGKALIETVAQICRGVIVTVAQICRIGVTVVQICRSRRRHSIAVRRHGSVDRLVEYHSRRISAGSWCGSGDWWLLTSASVLHGATVLDASRLVMFRSAQEKQLISTNVQGYSGDLNSKLVRYSDHGDLFVHYMVGYSNAQYHGSSVF